MVGHILTAVTDDHIIGALNHIRESFEGGRLAAVWAEAQSIVAADGVVGLGMESFLNIRAVKVVVRPSRKGREAQHIPQEWTVVRQVVDCETRISCGLL